MRFFAEIPIIFKVLGWFSFLFVEIQTPEQQTLFINPILHTPYFKDYEPEVRKAILRYTKKGMVAYDVGANVGVFSLLFSSIVGENGVVYAFEPEKNNYVCLEKSIVVINNIVLDKRAVGLDKNIIRFDRRGGAFSGRIVDRGRYKVSKNIIDVPVVSIDVLIADEMYRVPDIIKIDVEGNEILVLMGMENTLTNHKPIIICELHTHLGDSVEKVKSLLQRHGYDLTINRNRLIAIKGE
jgi:FkbM family methyltransferase